MADNIFTRREGRELQNLRQRQASNVISINPNLKGFTQRFNPDVSRASLLRAQRERAPTAAELEKSVGVKTAKKLKKRRGKNLRGEVARAIREQRRFERGERRDRPEQEPRIVGDPVPGAAAAEDPALQRRRLDLEEARDRNRQLERIADRRADQATQERELAVRRGELAGARADRAAQQRLLPPPGPAAPAAPPADPNEPLRLAIEGRRITAQDAQQRRLVEALGAERKEARLLLGRGEIERKEAAALREAEIKEERNERALLADRASGARLEDRDARLEREREIAAANVARDERERGERVAQSDVTAKERRGELQAAGIERREESKQAREERKEILERERDIADPVPERFSHADREFLQRGLDQGLETIERRIGESEERTSEQIRQHAERVGGGREERDPTINIYNPVQPPGGPAQPAGPSAQEIAESIRLHLESPRGRERRTTRRRLPIEEASTDTEAEEYSPTRSERRRRRQGGGSGSPEFITAEEDTDPSGFEEEGGGFSPIQSPRRPARVPPASLPAVPTQVREDQPEGQIRVPGGDVDPFARDPTQDDFSQGGARQSVEDEPVDLPTDFDRPFGPIRGDEDYVEVEAEPEQVFAEPEQVEAEPEEDIFQPQQFAGELAQNAIGFVGDVAGGAMGGIRGLFQQEEEGPQTGGLLVDPSIAPPAIPPTIQPLQSESPRRRKYIGRDPRTGPPSQTLQEFQAERRQRQQEEVGGEDPESSGSDVSFGSFLEGIDTPSPQSSPERDNPPRLEPVGQEILAPAAPKKESSLEESLRAAQSELETLQRRNRAAGQSGRQRAQGKRSVGSLAGTKFARKAGGVPPAELESAEERVRSLRGLVSVQREQERIREITEQAREAGTPRQGFTTEAPIEPLLQTVNPVATPAEQRTNAQLFDSMEGEIDSYYTRGRSQGGARGSLPFTITNTTNRKYKGLQPGQSATLDQIERDGKLGYYPGGQVSGVKAGITRISRIELKRQIKEGKLKVDRKR